MDNLPPVNPIPPTSSGPDEKQWKVIMHLSALIGLVVPCGNIIAPLIIWLLKKQDMPSLDPEGRKVLNFQISYTIYMVLAGLSMFFCIGMILLPAVALAWLIFLILGAIKASNGESYDFPLTIKML